MSYRIVADEANKKFIIVQPKDIDLYLDGGTVEEAISKYEYWLKNNLGWLERRVDQTVSKLKDFTKWREKFSGQ